MVVVGVVGVVEHRRGEEAHAAQRLGVVAVRDLLEEHQQAALVRAHRLHGQVAFAAGLLADERRPHGETARRVVGGGVDDDLAAHTVGLDDAPDLHQVGAIAAAGLVSRILLAHAPQTIAPAAAVASAVGHAPAVD